MLARIEEEAESFFRVSGGGEAQWKMHCEGWWKRDGKRTRRFTTVNVKFRLHSGFSARSLARSCPGASETDEKELNQLEYFFGQLSPVTLGWREETSITSRR